MRKCPGEGVAVAEQNYSSPVDLLAAVKRSDPRALREFLDRYFPLAQRIVRKLGVGPDNVREVAMTVLDDILVGLTGPGSLRIGDIEAYIVIAARNHVLSERNRDQSRKNGQEETRIADLPDGDIEMLISSRSPDCSTTIERVYAKAIERLTPAECELLAYMTEWVPPRVIADWLKIEHGTARQRIFRLKQDLRRNVLREVNVLPTDERKRMQALLKRAGWQTGQTQSSVRVAEPDSGYDGTNAQERRTP